MCEITTLPHQVVKIVHKVNSSLLCLQYEASNGKNQLSNTTILKNQKKNNGWKFSNIFRQILTLIQTYSIKFVLPKPLT